MWYLFFGVGLFALGLVTGALVMRKHYGWVKSREGELADWEARLIKLSKELRG